MRTLRRILLCLLAAAVAWQAESAGAVTIRVDYRYDRTSFFGSGTPARAAMDAAAAFYSNIVNDTLSAVQAPTYFGAQGGKVNWFWRPYFPNPSLKDDYNSTAMLNPPLGANEYVVYVGARDLDGADVGVGGPGGYLISRLESGSFNAQDDVQIAQIESQFETLVKKRGETSGFAAWGGSLAVDNATNWHLDHTTAPLANKIDLYSVLLHELAHVFGFGASSEWSDLTNASGFTGSQATAQYGQGTSVPVVSSGEGGHWNANVVDSGVYGATGSQRPLMVPALASGVRRRLTNLDAASLVDIGWEITLPQPVPGDYNRNGIVDAADYTVWRDTLGSTSDLRANGNKSGASANKIDQADYAFWKSRFGQTSGSGSGGGAISAPEPTGFVLSLAVGLYLAGFRRRKVSIGSSVT